MKKETFLLILLFLPVSAQEAELSLKKIMADSVWIGQLPSEPKLGEDGGIYFSVNQANPLPSREMRYDLATGSLDPVTDNTRMYAEMTFVHEDGDKRIYALRGDLWVTRGAAAPQPLIAHQERIRFIRAAGKNEIIYREGENLFLYNLNTGADIQITNLLTRSEAEKPSETFYTVEEKRLFQYVDNLYVSEQAEKEQEKESKTYGSFRKPEPVYLGKGMNIGFGENGLTIDKSLRWIAVTLQPQNQDKATEYARFITKEGFVRTAEARPRVGDENLENKLTIIDRNDNSLKWFDVSDLPEIETNRLKEITDSLSEADKKFLPKISEGPRAVRIHSSGFSKDGTQLLVNVFSLDFKDRWIVLLNPDTMEKKLVHHTYDPAWVDSVGGFWRADGKNVMLLSDFSGHIHLHAYDLATEEMKALTNGNFEIMSAEESQDGKLWYFHSNRQHPGEIHFYSMPIDGGEWTAFTKEPGHHEIYVSEKGTMYGLFSQANLPPQLRVREKSGWKTIYDGRSEAFKAINWHVPEVTTYTNRDGKEVYARLYKPEKPNGAAVVFSHGAGYLQNAHKGWSDYFREYMFHNMLMREGYTVLDPDYQASSGYGRDWRTAIYRYMGDKDLNDIIDGAGWLVENHGVDKQRIGTYGGSYGGFLTLMAMFTSPDTFAAGAALRPVTDWSYYNHYYTKRILNTPQEDPIAFRRSSPIYFAENLKGRLLICHGMVDDNVHYQDSVRLAQRLIELGKENWELSSYPVEEHGFKTPSGWYDEYRRIYEMFRETLK